MKSRRTNQPEMTYAPPQHWDRYFGELHQAGDDLDWGEQWTGPFVKHLDQANVRTILDLGCGTGNEVRTLTEAGFVLVGLDYSRQGLHRAQAKVKANAVFVLADMACPLPFAVAAFEAVMSNVALHMFCDALTRSLFAEVRRVVRPQGLFLFHVNALEDRPLRAERTPPVQAFEANYILENTGQTMPFFSKAYLLELLADWPEVTLEAVTIRDRETGQSFKQVWRGIGRR